METLYRKKDLRHGSKPNARNDFLRRLAAAFWSHREKVLLDTRDEKSEYQAELLAFLRRASRDARPRVECPKTWDGVGRILPRRLHRPPVADLKSIAAAVRGFRAGYPPKERTRDNAEVYLERAHEHLRDEGLPCPAGLADLRRVLKRVGLHEPQWKQKPASGRA
jgi:hypothetical protein